MWRPIVTGRPVFADAVDMRSTTPRRHVDREAACSRILVPRSHPHTPGWPASARPSSRRAVPERRRCGIAYQLRRPAAAGSARPPETIRKRRSPSLPPSAQLGAPVGAAHMTDEERDEQGDAGLDCAVGGVDQPVEDRRVDRRRRRLGVFPTHEDPDRVEPDALCTLEVATRAGRIVGAQPVHRLRRRPVVDTEPERLQLGRAHAITAAYASRGRRRPMRGCDRVSPSELETFGSVSTTGRQRRRWTGCASTMRRGRCEFERAGRRLDTIRVLCFGKTPSPRRHLRYSRPRPAGRRRRPRSRGRRHPARHALRGI